VSENSSKANDFFNPMQITDGEVNYLWSFIQGGIMEASVWQRLIRSWGFCERHAWVTLSVEMAFRRSYLLGPTILYHSLVAFGLEALRSAFLGDHHAAASRLKTRGLCLVCEMNISSGGARRRSQLDTGKKSENLRTFASGLESFWQQHTCPRCVPVSGGDLLCRRHLIDEIFRGVVIDWGAYCPVLTSVAERISRYEQSFTWEHRGIAVTEDQASLLVAAGWCSGWQPLLVVMRSAMGTKSA